MLMNCKRDLNSGCKEDVKIGKEDAPCTDENGIECARK